MPKKLTITVSDQVYVGLHRNVGRRNINRFIDGVLRPRVAGLGGGARLGREPTESEIARGYAELAAYEANHTKEIEEADDAWLQELIDSGRGPNLTGE